MSQMRLLGGSFGSSQLEKSTAPHPVMATNHKFQRILVFTRPSSPVRFAEATSRLSATSARARVEMLGN